MPTALVTGGGRGIGYAAAALLGAGFDVAIASLEPDDEAAAAVDRLRSRERRICYFSVDIADIATHAPPIDEIRARLGAIHCLVDNAGVRRLRRNDQVSRSFSVCRS